ncbi:DUF3592 domain-containing protein [Polaribacter sp. BAL334]|uniref:DUF3592 domain-containing protein n=1 Tax=Polaribacter sp. BAL334 TaxID=1708178 RepID=UPI0018D218B2|nr:DUF3592 domain-containing protein [Polaribacter sp. BAL334]MBG7612420.1 DUF3592 domain-containing protein [Polaribacter sp. BAL334]
MEKIGLIFGLLFILLGLIFLTLTLINLYFNDKIKDWQSLNAKVLKSSLTEKKEEFNIDTDIYSSSTRITYEQKIEFEYDYDGEKYKSDKIYYLEFNEWFLTNNQKKELSKNYYKDKRINIYLNPKDKCKAFLIDEFPINKLIIYMTITFIAGLFFLLQEWNYF